MSLDTREFDALDLLVLLDAHRHPILQTTLANELGITMEATHRRMKVLKRDGLVEIDAQASTLPTRYMVSVEGLRVFRLELDRMAGIPLAPPALNHSVWNASRVAAGVLEAAYGALENTHGTEAAA